MSGEGEREREDDIPFFDEKSVNLSNLSEQKNENNDFEASTEDPVIRNSILLRKYHYTVDLMLYLFGFKAVWLMMKEQLNFF